MALQNTGRLCRVGGVFVACAVALAWVTHGEATAPVVAADAAHFAQAWSGFQDHDPFPDDRRDDPWEDEYDKGRPERPDPSVAHLRRLTKEEIQRIRYLELRSFRLTTNRPDRVTVRIPRQTVDDFLLEMEGHEDFRGEPTRREFRKLTPPQKLHFIALYQGESFADKLEILSDPEIFLDFRRNVMPIVLRGCATSGCHTHNYRDEHRFGLYRDPKRLAATTYANFIMLNEVTVNGQPLINRAQPENSLLLTYMLPDREVKMSMRHPEVVGRRPIYQTRAAPGYRRIEEWIAELRQPTPDYGVSFFERESPSEADDDEEDDWRDAP